MSAFYHELRPAYTGEASYAALVTVEGTGTIAGQTFAAVLRAPDGTEVPGATAVVDDAAARRVLVTLPGRATPGECPWEVRRTDDGTNLVVAHGRLDVTPSGGRV